jgi:protein involved in polysaccharide export with SLBB domain
MIKLMRVIVHGVPVLLLCLIACAAPRSQIQRTLNAGGDTAPEIPSAAEAYGAACPDVLEIQVQDRPGLSGRRRVGPDGRIDVAELGRLRVEGQPTSEIARRLARVAGLPEDAVRVQVVEYNSQHVYLAGQSAGLRHVVDYRGPENVVDLLRRVGGITPGAAPDEVFLVRTHAGEDKSPEVFRINLRAILLQNDPRTDVVVQPLDRIYIGEKRTFSFEKCIPPWLRPIYETLVGIRDRGAMVDPGQSKDHLASGILENTASQVRQRNQEIRLQSR